MENNLSVTESNEFNNDILNSNFDINSLEIKPIDLSSINKREPLAFIIDNVLTLEECNALINLTENDPNIKYEEALLNIGEGKQISAKDVRNSSRYIRDDFIISSQIFNRISHLLPQTWKWGNRTFPLSCLNERLRFLKYKKGEYFKCHQDGMYGRDDGSETSFVTLQLYLNEGFQGGETTFLNNLLNAKVPVIPKPGRALVFEHNIFHEGSKLIDGIKYVIRTDVMYKTSK
ncbi:hypothetical protein RclHR1_08490013 [Rhizophagus clarus]|uniref:Probable prolyl 4-hydroxylase 3 isoform X4 n=1 Tax=Rhizophagus clarus TaxID=94130 RepID=A0A2Z6SNI8_9GLOM|nr:hypothetical protein RclHR1_08490013 [Rhizophagus clarus]GES84349.1 probable prolyl 4-hydroxylase 3 isoform X4 [Rhizophagus clarus]